MSDEPRRVERRTILMGAVALSGFRILPSGAAVQEDLASVRPREGDLLVKLENGAPTPLKPVDVPERAAPLLVWAMDPASKVVRNGSRLNQIIVMRFAPDKLAARTRARAAEGVVAYTAICTHGGCEVVDWLSDDQALSCSCHSSLFDPADEASVIGGPAPRSLPALPLALTDGYLSVAGPFTSIVGFESA